MPDSTGAERARRYRERKAGRIAAATRLECSACGRQHTGARGTLCSRCWQSLTSEGRADRAARVARSRARRAGQGVTGALQSDQPKGAEH